MFVAELYGTWEGRIGRLMHVGALVALTIVYELVLLATGHPLVTGRITAMQGLLAFVVIYPSWVVSVKRAHDLGKSGWWLFGWTVATIPTLILIAIGAAMSHVGNSGAAMVCYLAAVVLGLASFWQIFIKLFFFAGMPGDNAFGPPPQIGKSLFGDGAEADVPAAGATATRSARPAMAPLVPASKVNAPAPRRPAAPVRPAGFGRRSATPA